MARNLERSIDRMRTRVSRAVFASTLLFWIAVIACACACVALGLRAALGWDAWRASIVFAALLLAPVLAARVARRKKPSAAGAAAWLDVRAGADGALVTGFETGAADWSKHIDAALARAQDLPRARLARPATMAVGALAFAALALLVPIPRSVPGPSRALQTAAIEKAEEKLATLEEEVKLEPELASELHASLERLKQDDAGQGSESVFEAADRAAEKLGEEAAAQADPAADAQRELSAAAAAAESDPQAAQEKLESALAALSKAGISKGLTDVMTSELGLESLELPPGTKLDAAQIARLSTALNARLGDKLAKLAAAGLLKSGKPGLAGKPGEIGEIAEHVCTDECRKNPGGT